MPWATKRRDGQILSTQERAKLADSRETRRDAMYCEIDKLYANGEAEANARIQRVAATAKADGFRQKRQAESRPAGNGPEIVPSTVADPYPDKCGIHQPRAVVKNAKASAIDTLYARGRLGEKDHADARRAAAERFRMIYERAEIGGSRAIDYGKVKVDVSFRYRDIPDATVAAVKELVEIRRSLRRHYDLVEKVAGHGYSLTELGCMLDRGPVTWRMKKFLGKTLIDGLDMLIEHFGVARAPVRSTIRAERAA
ncbi:MAG: hypothetical protein JSS66_19040 [Armatimonadetes bacterium]|nr:hypothetical protein [Armatimonadota bacterium]